MGVFHFVGPFMGPNAAKVVCVDQVGPHVQGPMGPLGLLDTFEVSLCSFVNDVGHRHKFSSCFAFHY